MASMRKKCCNPGCSLFLSLLFRQSLVVMLAAPHFRLFLMISMFAFNKKNAFGRINPSRWVATYAPAPEQTHSRSTYHHQPKSHGDCLADRNRILYFISSHIRRTLSLSSINYSDLMGSLSDYFNSIVSLIWSFRRRKYAFAPKTPSDRSRLIFNPEWAKSLLKS